MDASKLGGSAPSVGTVRNTKVGSVAAEPVPGAEFWQMLQTLQSPLAPADTGMTGLDTDAQQLTEGLLAELEVPEGLLDLAGLVGQTAQLDQRVERAWLPGSLAAGRADAAPGTLSLGLATVAAGVANQPFEAAVPAEVAEQENLAGVTEETPADTAPEPARPTSPEGRISLSAQWTAEASAAPALQRLVGQVEQWLAAQGGSSGQPRPGAKPGSAPESAESGLVATGPAGGSRRLLETAVTQVEAAQSLVPDEPPTEDVRFWLQPGQQRAELTLEQDGRPVRVQVHLQGNQAQITFSSDQAQTRQMLDAGLAELRELLAQQGLDLAGMTVQAEASGSQSHEGSDAHQPALPGAGRSRQIAVAVPSALAPASAERRVGGVDLFA